MYRAREKRINEKIREVMLTELKPKRKCEKKKIIRYTERVKGNMQTEREMYRVKEKGIND